MSAHELVIVGAGPAGVSAALWARSHELEPLLLEAGEQPGGQLLHVHFEPRDVAGMEPGDGLALAARYREQLARRGVVVRQGVEVKSLTLSPRPVLTLGSGETIATRTLLVASGARRRRLGVPGERELEDRGVSYSATRDRERLAGRAVAVVGGGDAACENALMLVTAGCEVTLIARGSVSARREFRDRVLAERRIAVFESARVVEVLGTTRVTGIKLAAPEGERTLACEGVVIKVGVVPSTEWCRDALPHDADGYLRVDAAFATTVPGVWAAGDVVRPAVMSLAVAVGQGALAAAAIRRKLRA